MADEEDCNDAHEDHGQLVLLPPPSVADAG